VEPLFAALNRESIWYFPELLESAFEKNVLHIAEIQEPYDCSMREIAEVTVISVAVTTSRLPRVNKALVLSPDSMQVLPKCKGSSEPMGIAGHEPAVIENS
jgi:hypothetical protein